MKFDFSLIVIFIKKNHYIVINFNDKK